MVYPLQTLVVYRREYIKQDMAKLPKLTKLKISRHFSSYNVENILDISNDTFVHY